MILSYCDIEYYFFVSNFTKVEIEALKSLYKIIGQCNGEIDAEHIAWELFVIKNVNVYGDDDYKAKWSKHQIGKMSFRVLV